MKKYQEKTREAAANCLLGDALRSASLDRMQMQPPSKLEMAWARARSAAAANPSLKAR